MAKFAVFEVVSEKIIAATGIAKGDLTSGQATGINLGAGLTAGLAAAVVRTRLVGCLSECTLLMLVLVADLPTRRHPSLQDQQDPWSPRRGHHLPPCRHVQDPWSRRTLHRSRSPSLHVSSNAFPTFDGALMQSL